MSDTISRQDVLALAKDVILINGAKHRCIDATQIHELPSAERVGKWIEDKYGNILCSECNWCAPKVMVGCLADRHLDYEKSDYCWHCGARMVNEDAE